MEFHAGTRQLQILQILKENTDEVKTISIVEIQGILREKYGLEPHRRTVAKDIDSLVQAGHEIECIRSTQNRYRFIGREFETAELKMLIDAVESAKFISKQQSENLIAKISKLAGPYVGAELNRNIDVEGRVKTENRVIVYIVDAINRAINEGKKISFQYFRYNAEKERIPRHDGEIYVLSPYKLVWNGDYYYVVGYSEKHEGISTFRVDRICNVPDILEENAAKPPKNFDMNKFLNPMHRMYNSDRGRVELICDNDVMDSIIDRYGIDVAIRKKKAETFNIVVETAVNHLFYSWVFGFGGKVKIVGPKNVKQDYIMGVAKTMEFLLEE